MKKSDELQKTVSELKEKIEALQEQNKIKDAAALLPELEASRKLLAAAKAEEEREMENAKKAAPIPEGSGKSRQELARIAFNKLVLQKGTVTDEEMSAYMNVTGSPGSPGQIGTEGSKGGYLVPTEQMKEIADLRSEFTQLRDFVTVKSTQYTNGNWPTLSDQDLIFTQVAELADRDESEISFGRLSYQTNDYALVIPISKQLIADAFADVVSICGRELALGAVRAENAQILTHLNTLAGDAGADAETITSYKTLARAVFKDLKRTYYNTAKIYTNQSGFLWLAELDDGNQRPLFVPDVTQPDAYRYRGKEIVVIEDDLLPNYQASGSTDEYAPFFIGDLKSYVYFFERQGMTLERDDSIFFLKQGIALMGSIRFGTALYDSEAMLAYKVKV